MFQGGQCNPNAQAVNANNPFKGFMNSLITSPQSMPLQGPALEGPNLEALTRAFESSWMQEQQAYMQMEQQRLMYLHNVWGQEKANQEIVQRQMLLNKNIEHQWQEAQRLAEVREWRQEFITHEVLQSKEAMLNQVD